MKFDMHCHTKEGSMDGKVMIEEYIRTLKRKGFGGMLVSDHDSYDGYREWKNAITFPVGVHDADDAFVRHCSCPG